MSPLKQGFGQSALHHLGTREYCPQDILLILNSYLWNFYYFPSNYVVLRVLAFMYYMDRDTGICLPNCKTPWQERTYVDQESSKEILPVTDKE